MSRLQQNRISSRWAGLLCAIATLFLCVLQTSAQLSIVRPFAPTTGPVSLIVEAPATILFISLIDATTGLELERRPCTPGEIDLISAFGESWVSVLDRVLYAQLIGEDGAMGSAVIIEPLTTPRRMLDGYTARIVIALQSRDSAALGALLAMSGKARETLRQEARPHPHDQSELEAPATLRLTQDVVLEMRTSVGLLLIDLRPGFAPRTAQHVRHLAAGGFYDGVSFHRIIAADAQGRPYLVQTGDPTGTGRGGCGWSIDLEPSTLPHDAGVLSMARLTDDPNSASSQFFICLGRDACAALDGSYAAFAQVIDGAEILRKIASSDESTVILESFRLLPAPPRVPGEAIITRLESEEDSADPGDR